VSARIMSTSDLKRFYMSDSIIVKRLLPDCLRGTLPSPVGPLTLVFSNEGLHALLFDRQTQSCAEALQGFRENRRHSVFLKAKSQLLEYFAGRRRNFDLQVIMAGTDFQKCVWGLLLDIPYGCTATYGEMAKQLGGVNRSRAVGGAIRINPVAIVVPCHRVNGQNGALTGFAGGLDVKKKLLDFERGNGEKLSFDVPGRSRRQRSVMPG
jgi:methylated-DNA-[protein]-cysteine S-methyltransferase